MTFGLLAIAVTLGVGDVHVPAKVTAETPCVLLIHGGGWSAMKRQDVVGIADFLRDDLGCVVYNIDYRLASPKNPWPDCGEDCVKAAEFMFTDAFAAEAGVRPKKIWVIGGSAGGHLTLWTALKLPAEKVAGAVSISGIADPMPDAACHPERYRALFGGRKPTAALFDSMNPMKLIHPNGPKVLCTHATGDKVVPIESATRFAEAYRAAGNTIEFYEYPSDVRSNLTGHCIWIPGSNPHRLIPEIEAEIGHFIAADSTLKTLADDFLNPPDGSKPWTYWLWMNGHTDERTIREELADIKSLGFGGVLLNDARGYWEDDNHVVTPPAEAEWMSASQVRKYGLAMRTACGLGLEMAINTSPNGGKLCGPWKVGADAPKRLLVSSRPLHPGESVGEPPPPKIEHYRPIALFAVRTTEPLPERDWYVGGDGVFTMEASSGRRIGRGHDRIPALSAVEIGKDWTVPQEGHWTLVRIGFATMEGHEYDVDILDPAAIRRHFERFFGPLKAEFGDLIGTVLTHLYSVSWEGAVPNWHSGFEKDFRRLTGEDIRPNLPILAGFSLPGVDVEAFLTKYRRARNDMFRENFYGTFADIAHAEGLRWFSESGGPWHRKKEVFGEADQLQFLAVNDVPQGEFWEMAGYGLRPFVRHVDDRTGRWHIRGAVNAAHIYDKPLVSVEAFTHMMQHWSVDPAMLKPVGDIGFADGANRYVWHTYTSSPERFGVPGIEYFAGTHINRNVTWHDDAKAFIAYLGRCQHLLQLGKPVTDIAVLGGDRTYSHWGRFRDRPSNEAHLDVLIPRGFSYDLVNDDALVKNPGLLNRYQIVYDVRKPENRGKTIPVGSLLPDAEGPFDWAHRRLGDGEWYFVSGEGEGEMVFRARAAAVETWDAVTGERRKARAERTADGRTRVLLDLPVGGSVFVVFLPRRTTRLPPRDLKSESVMLEIKGPWKLDFAYPRGISSKPPQSVTLEKLVDFTALESLRHFSGMVSYRTSFELGCGCSCSGGGVRRARLSLGTVLSGLAHVYLNGIDCGTVWCAPWESDVSAALKAGRNELEVRYVNNWMNRLTGDCELSESSRVTKSDLHYWTMRRTFGGVPWDDYFDIRPTPFSGPASGDPLQPSGILGPLQIRLAEKEVEYAQMTERAIGPQSCERGK